MTLRPVENICIIGTGLIGGSLALALKKAGYCRHLTGVGRTEANLVRAQELGVVDSYSTEISAGVENADIIVVCVPLGAMRAVFEGMKDFLREDAVVTDAGSAKQCVMADAEETLQERYERFVPGHPIAGTENSGVDAAFDSLYQQRRVILTPDERTHPDAVHRVRDMWQAAGAEVESMTAEHHDLVLAATSHLPHMLAFGLVDCLNNLEDVNEIFRFAAGGFRDFTRIASSDPVMWRDICLSNREDVLVMMRRYFSEMKDMYRALEESDGVKLKEIFTRAKKARDAFCE